MLIIRRHWVCKLNELIEHALSMAWILDIDTTVTIYSDIKVAPRPVTTRLSWDTSAAQFVPMGLAICDSCCKHMFRAASLSVQRTAFPSLSWNIRVQNMGQRYRVRADCENCFDDLKSQWDRVHIVPRTRQPICLNSGDLAEKMRCKL